MLPVLRYVDESMVQLARAQQGVFSAAQVHGAGGTRALAARRVRSGHWERLSSRVFGVPGTPDSFERQLMAAVLHDPGTVVSHTSAARLHNFLTVSAAAPEITTCTCGPRRNPFARVHVSADLREEDIMFLGDLPVTSLPRTAADLLTVFSRRRVERIIDDLLAGRRMTVEDLAGAHARYARGGRPTTVVMREILVNRGPGHVAPASVLESMALELVRDAGLPEPERQAPLPGWGEGPALTDLAWPGPRVIVELDGRRWHDRDAAFERDRERDNAAILSGWSPFRFTHRHLTERPGYVLATMRRALARNR